MGSGPEARVLELARAAGFDLAGIAPLRPPRDAGRFRDWLAAGFHGEMGWLERNAERIEDPRRVLSEGRSMLVVALAHSRPATALSDGARVARYATGRDYHNVMGKKLAALATELRRAGLARATRKVVDAGPLLERSHAAEAGVGFASKAANLLHPAFGPWFFLGEILLDVELEPTGAAPPAGSCGTCTACLDACPTGAIVEPGSVDARRCLSYLTIEHRGPIAPELRPELGPWVFGCDVCSEVCPWGRAAPDLGARFGRHPALAQGDDASQGLVAWLESRPEEFVERFHGSPLRRAGRAGLLRNAALVLGNRPSDRGQRALLHALDFDPSELVRGAAAWALGRGWKEEAAVRERLDRRRRSDPDAGVCREAERALGEFDAGPIPRGDSSTRGR